MFLTLSDLWISFYEHLLRVSELASPDTSRAPYEHRQSPYERGWVGRRWEERSLQERGGFPKDWDFVAWFSSLFRQCYSRPYNVQVDTKQFFQVRVNRISTRHLFSESGFGPARLKRFFNGFFAPQISQHLGNLRFALFYRFQNGFKTVFFRFKTCKNRFGTT